jgi:hypothetical protein
MHAGISASQILLGGACALEVYQSDFGLRKHRWTAALMETPSKEHVALPM